MAAILVSGSPQELQLQNALQSRLVETGFISGDDSGLADYIVLMLSNGKAQAEVQSEVADTLDVAPNDQSISELVNWLFEQVNALHGGDNETSKTTQSQAATHSEDMDTDGNRSMQESSDADMGDTSATQIAGSVPTGPKAMRSSSSTGSGRRMLGNLNRAMNRTQEPTMHRIKGTAGTGRINSHIPRGPTPKGPRSTARQQMQNMPMSAVNNMLSNNPFNGMSPQNQMQMLAMYEQQARMMQDMFSPQQQQMFAAQGGFGMTASQMNPNSGKSLFERIDTNTRQNGHQREHGRVNTRNQNAAKENNAITELTSSMEVESDRPDPASTICHYNTFCTKPDCPFVHQSPAAPPNTAVDMTDECSFGAACVNRKCVGKHPSPAKRAQHKSEQQCKFFPNCTNPHCPFMHPSTPPCRNGADCTVPGCKFIHSTVACKFNPCLNSNCTFKHSEGQKRGQFSDKVWVNPEAEEEGEGGQQANKHVSERKFVDESMEEELILPEKNQNAVSAEDGNAEEGPSGADNIH